MNILAETRDLSGTVLRVACRVVFCLERHGYKAKVKAKAKAMPVFLPSYLLTFLQPRGKKQSVAVVVFSAQLSFFFFIDCSDPPSLLPSLIEPS